MCNLSHITPKSWLPQHRLSKAGVLLLSPIALCLDRKKFYGVVTSTYPKTVFIKEDHLTKSLLLVLR